MGGGSNSKAKGQPRAMAPVAEVDIAAVRYEPRPMQAPHLTGFGLRAFVWLLESRLLGPLVLSALKKQNNMTQMLQNTVIPERPMYYPEFPPQGCCGGVGR
ncbi:fatty acid amide hydrolase [Lolium perenne]|uniref:fatty acid amide hydrolase n=1 Tax=Lolium perenne TaxID=4522 RepID=UPI003A9A1B35